MKKILFSFVLVVLISCNDRSETTSSEPSMLTQPIVVEDDDWSFEGTQHLIFVPENRNDPNSRKIGVQFLKFPAREQSNLAPVVFLGAGPGEPYSAEVFFKGRRAEAWRYELHFVNQKRDVILINQRGNPEAPGLRIPHFEYKWNNGGSLDKPFDLALMNKNRREAYVTFLAQYKAQGIDPRGYDMKHFVDDIEAVRQQLNYEKIALIGNSFGSQWALSYIRMYPSKVDRALFSGIEPMENNYDDPDGRWKVLEKIATDAEADPVISKQIPEGGLMEAFKTVITRLENNPVSVQLIDEDTGEVETVVVGADDLRYNLMNEGDRSYTSEIESWPKYILEMYQGDFRLLASNSIGRIYNSSSKMINPLVNNSLGISKQREALLDSRESKRWLGDVNMHYTATRDVCPAPKVSDEFLEPVKNNIPMILIHGDMDMSTPHGNATELMEYLENGHLISVKRGFHNAKRALIFKDSLLIDKVYGFMNLDFEQDSFQDFSETIPSEYELPAFKFWPIDGESLYDRYSK